MKTKLPFLLLTGIIFLNGCGGRKNNKASLPKSKEVAHNSTVSDIKFFDEDILDDIETFVLDDQSTSKNLSLAALSDNDLSDAQFSLEEPIADSIDEKMLCVYFDYDSDHLRTDQTSALTAIQEQINTWVKQGKKVVFKGHSCKWHGTRAYNIALSNKRAHYLANLCNVPKRNLKVFGVGNEEAVTLENSLRGQAPNRRVEIYPLAA